MTEHGNSTSFAEEPRAILMLMSVGTNVYVLPVPHANARASREPPKVMRPSGICIQILLAPVLFAGDQVLLQEVWIYFKAQSRSRRDRKIAFANLRRI